MSGRGLDLAQESFGFIESLDDLQTGRAVLAAMDRAFALFGFENFIITGLPHPEQRIETLVLLKKWPAAWYEHYTARRLDRFDPVIRLCRGSVQPFQWSEAPYDPDLEPRAGEVMHRAADFGLRRGFCLPVHGLNGFEACLSMSGTHLDLTPRTKPALHLMAMYAVERARQICRRASSSAIRSRRASARRSPGRRTASRPPIRARSSASPSGRSRPIFRAQARSSRPPTRPMRSPGR